MILLLTLLVSFFASAKPLTCKDFEAVAASSPSSSLSLKKLLDQHWRYLKQEYPEMATRLGESQGGDRWTDISISAIERRKAVTSCLAKILKKLPRAKLRGEDLINYDLFLYRTEMAAAENRFPSEYLTLSHLSGLHLNLPDAIAAMPTRSMRDYQNIVARLEKVSLLEQQTEALLREGLKRQITPVKMFLVKVPEQIDRVTTADIEGSPFWKPFQDIKISLTDEQKADLQKSARLAIKEHVFPSLKKLKEFVVSEYIPGAREGIAWKEMPDGTSWYEFLVKDSTTTNMTSAELHQLGLSEVARITEEMNRIRQKTNFKGDLSAFNQFLLNDPQFYFTEGDQLLRAFRDLAKRIDPELPRLFKTLPRLTYGVREIPEYKAKSASAAYYTSGNINAGTAGYFEANTYDLKARPKWAMEALTFHESVPGHHLQIALAQEIEGLPEFRKYGGDTAFIEGWGLYAETLGEELGFYKDPYAKYGQLTYEMWRAVRLVVDTGIHFYGWDREKAVTYFQSKMPKTRMEAEVEIDRYITWPGQALAYKVGQLKFRELRSKAESALGTDFNVREFHDELLRHGSLPLDVLEKTVHAWIENKKTKKETHQ